MHPPVVEYVQQAVEKHGPFDRVVEFGSLDINGSVRHFFGDAFYLGIDMQEGPGVDLVEDAAHWDGRGEWNCVVSTEVLEHAPMADAICRSAYRALRPGGVFIVTAASTNRGPHSGIDEQPIRSWEFYRNVTEEQLKGWTAAFSRADIEYHWRGDIYATCVK